MVSYENSIHALQELLLKPLSPKRHSIGRIEDRNNRYVNDDSNNNSSSSFYECQITKISEDISCLGNGVRYCFIEVTCDDGKQYGIQAFGDEAVELYKEALKHLSQEKEERSRFFTKLVIDVQQEAI